MTTKVGQRQEKGWANGLGQCGGGTTNRCRRYLPRCQTQKLARATFRHRSRRSLRSLSLYHYYYYYHHYTILSKVSFCLSPACTGLSTACLASTSVTFTHHCCRRVQLFFHTHIYIYIRYIGILYDIHHRGSGKMSSSLYNSECFAMIRRLHD